MSQPCGLVKCSRTSRGLCDCCKQNLCLQHLNEHNALLISELDSLADEINALGNRFKTLNIQKTNESYYEKLDQWRVKCHEEIDRFFELKHQQLNECMSGKVREQEKEYNRLQSKVAELIREQETTKQDIDLLTSSIRHLEEQLHRIDRTYFQINIRPLVIDDDCICINEKIEHEIDLLTLSSTYKKINYPLESRMALTCNGQHVLIHRKPNLCLIDREMNIVKQTVWYSEKIYDFCWSSTLNKFVVIDENNVFLIDKNTLMIENVPTIKERWLSCTCSDTTLFLSTKRRPSSIVQYNLLPSMKFIKEWKSSHISSRDEIIHNIVYTNETLALIVKNKSDKVVRMELRSIETFDSIWILQLDIPCNDNAFFHCCSLMHNEWLIADHENGRFLHITNDGKMKKTFAYNPNPHRVILFELDTLVVSTKNEVKFHKL
ncbi:unnamed protein product [Adineta steineri]|uniref:Uncharacterized protein n=1 Tax=Adineta steineri TaxID=433720 RepID=A0A813R2S4_9BILA|nr:unnamed protein product [Adineta steineri]CAF1196706.1 unnamed protein product [Adineta steineri]